MNEGNFDGFVYGIFRDGNNLRYKCYNPTNSEVLSIEMVQYLHIPKSQAGKVEKYNKLGYYLIGETYDSGLQKDIESFLKIYQNTIDDVIYFKVPHTPYTDSVRYLVLVKFKNSKYRTTVSIREQTSDIIKRILENSKKGFIGPKKYRVSSEDRVTTSIQNKSLKLKTKQCLDKFKKSNYVSEHSKKTRAILNAIIALIPYDKDKL